MGAPPLWKSRKGWPMGLGGAARAGKRVRKQAAPLFGVSPKKAAHGLASCGGRREGRARLGSAIAFALSVPQPSKKAAPFPDSTYARPAAAAGCSASIGVAPGVSSL